MPTYRPTNTGFETRGRFNRFFEPASMAIVMGVFIISVIVTFLAGFLMKIGLIFAVCVLFVLPNLASLLIVFFLIQGKPPRHLADVIRTHVKGHSAARAWEDGLPPLDL
jgi:hypothetical protein